MYNVQCAMYNVQCTMCNVQCAMCNGGKRRLIYGAWLMVIGLKQHPLITLIGTAGKGIA